MAKKKYEDYLRELQNLPINDNQENVAINNKKELAPTRSSIAQQNISVPAWNKSNDIVPIKSIQKNEQQFNQANKEYESKKTKEDYLRELQSLKIKETTPGTTDTNKWFKGGAFEEDSGLGIFEIPADITKTILGTGADVITKIGSTLWNMGGDLGKLGAGAIAQLTGNEKVKRRIAGKDEETNKRLENLNIFNRANEVVDKSSILGDKSDKIVESIGQIGGYAAATAVGLGTPVMFGTAAGASLGENYAKENVTDTQAWINALAKGGIATLTEKAFGLFSKGKGIDTEIANKISSNLSSGFAKTLARMGVQATGEAAEEAMEYLGDQVLDLITDTASQGKGAKFHEDWNWEELGAQMGNAFLSSLLVGAGQTALGVKNAEGSNIKEKVNEFAKQQDIANKSKSKNEQKVIDLLVQEQLEEKQKNGEKVNKKEITEQVEKDLEKGYVDIEKIEEALGGNLYSQYQNILDQQEEINNKIKTLENTKLSDMTYKQQEELKSLREQLENLNVEDIRKQLRSYVNSLTQNDPFIRNGYNEYNNKGNAYQVDLDSIDEKLRPTYERAMQSNILNNTNRTHDFVNLIAKLENDKGLVFNFTNNENLKNTGFSLDDGIFLNIDSDKALNSVVGYDITRALEGTELYDALKTTIKDYAESRGEYETKLNDLKELYKETKDTDIENEITAELVGDYLFTDEEFVNRLSVENRNLFQKIYDEIKYLAKLITTRSKEGRQLEKAKRTFEKAYRQITINQSVANSNAKYDLKESGKIIDDNGKPITFLRYQKNAMDMTDDFDYNQSDVSHKTGFGINLTNSDMYTKGKESKDVLKTTITAKKGLLTDTNTKVPKKQIDALNKVFNKYIPNVTMFGENITDGQLIDQINIASELIANAEDNNTGRKAYVEFYNAINKDGYMRTEPDGSKLLSVLYKESIDAFNNSNTEKNQNGKYSTGNYQVKGKDIKIQDIAPIETTEEVKETTKPKTKLPIEPTKEEAYENKKTRAKVREELSDEMNITTEDLDVGKDISSLGYQRTDPIRLNEKVFGAEIGEKINNATIRKTYHNEAERTRFLNKERQEIKNLGIKARSKESAAVQKYGEKQYLNENNDLVPYTDADLAREFSDVATQEKIKKAAKEIRNKYDTYIDEINKAITEMGYDPIPKRQDYMRHFQEIGDKLSQWGIPLNKESLSKDTLPTDINGVTDQFKPGKNWFASAMQRKGLKTTYDAITGIDGYLEGASNLIYHTADIQRYRALAKQIRDTYGQSHGLDNVDLSTKEGQKRLNDIFDNKLSKYAAWLDEQANALAGKKGGIDRAAERLLGRRIYTIAETAKKQVGSNMTGFNVRSALTNFASAVQGASKTNKMAFIKGTVSTIKNMINNDGLIEKSDFLTNRFGSDNLSKKLWQKASNAGQTFMTGTDYFTANQIWRSKYYENLDSGMSESEAIKKADDFASRVMGDRAKGMTAEIFNSKTLGLLSQFQLEVNNQWSSIVHDNKMDLQRGNKSGATVMFQLGQLAAMSYMFNNFMKAMTGSDVMIDPIDLLKELLGWNDDDEETTLEERSEKVLGDLVNDLPFVSFMTGGRIPIQEAFTGAGTAINKITGQKDKYGNDITWEDVKDDAITSALYWLLPTGYGQLKKTSKGLSMYDENLPLPGSYTASGNLRFNVEDTTGEKIKAALFGEYSSEEAQKYRESGYKTISSKKIQELKDLGMNASEYRKYSEDLKEAGTTNADKIDFITNSNYTDKQKNIMGSNVLKKDFNVKEYKKYGSYEEADYAINNPEKYLVSKVTTNSFGNYKKYLKEIGDIKADKDKNGKSINNSRKNKVIDYISNLNEDMGSKMILYKMQYPSDDTYNNEIVEYLNNKDNITLDQEKTILQYLGMTITDKGTVRW